jgi:hypothetical protein
VHDVIAQLPHYDCSGSDMMQIVSKIALRRACMLGYQTWSIEFTVLARLSVLGVMRW